MNNLVRTTAAALLLPVFAAPGVGQEIDPTEAMALKCEELRQVVAELRQRPCPDASPEFRAARAATLDRLEQYAAAGRFTINDRFPFDMPYFIDRDGTRCAVAHLIESSGRSDLLLDLAATENNSHVAELLHRRELLDWARANGLRVQEIAYIQGPGVDDGGGPQTPPVPPTFSEPTPNVDTGPRLVQLPADRAQVPVADAPRTTPGRSTPGPAVTGALGRRRATTVSFTWADWWNLHRGDLASVRERYHRRGNFTDRPGAARASAPSDAVLRDRILPTLRGLLEEDSTISTTAALGIAHAAHRADPEQALEDLLQLARSVRGEHQVYPVLALGLLPDGLGVPALADIAADRREGRGRLARGSRIDERMRSFAALGLGFSGHAEAALALRELIEKERGAELSRCAILALGLLSAEPGADRSGTRLLLTRFLEDQDDARIASVIPLALAASGSSAALPTLGEVVQKFRGPDEVRMACAVALGRIGDPIEPELSSALMDLVRRDVHAPARQAAIVALAERARRAARTTSATERQASMDELAEFLLHGVRGDYRQAADRPWHALAAGLLARAHAPARASLEEELRHLLREGNRDDRAAATIALSMTGGRGAREDLLVCLEDRDPLLAAYAAEGAGVLDESRARPILARLVQESSSDFVRYHAARGLALLADDEALALLHSAVEKTGNDAVRASLMQAIGEIGDVRSIDLLTRLAQDRKSDHLTRARAVGALGKLARPGDESWVLPLHRMAHSTLVTGAVKELLSIR